MKIKKAVKIFIKNLKKDPDFYNAYQANIAVQFQDMYHRKKKEKKYINTTDVHQISNDAAREFLNLLIGYSKHAK